jgi:hypothetical protein
VTVQRLDHRFALCVRGPPAGALGQLLGHGSIFAPGTTRLVAAVEAD